jgi:type I restriction enzyme S subunit
MQGSDTSYKKLHRLREGQIVMSRLKAFEGAIAVVPPAFDGWVLSPEFPTFTCKPGKALPAYLAHICQWPDFWGRLAFESTGIGARRERVSADRLLSIEIPLPSIHEQAAIANKLDSVSLQCAQAREIALQVGSVSDALRSSAASRPDLADRDKTRAGWRRVRLGEVMTQREDIVRVRPADEYPNFGILSFGRGVFEKPPIDGTATSATVLNRVRSGQFIYSRLFAFEGAYAFVPERFDGWYVSGEFPTFDAEVDVLDASWLAAYLGTPQRWAELGAQSKGLGLRRQRVHVEAVLNYEIWLPPFEEQLRFVALSAMAGELATLRARVEEFTDSIPLAALNAAISLSR